MFSEKTFIYVVSKYIYFKQKLHAYVNYPTAWSKSSGFFFTLRENPISLTIGISSWASKRNVQLVIRIGYIHSSCETFYHKLQGHLNKMCCQLWMSATYNEALLDICKFWDRLAYMYIFFFISIDLRNKCFHILV